MPLYKVISPVWNTPIKPLIFSLPDRGIRSLLSIHTFNAKHMENNLNFEHAREKFNNKYRSIEILTANYLSLYLSVV